MKQNFTVRQGALDGVEAFLSVAQRRSFRQAAAELGVTPSAISQAVRALEARVGATLFVRTTRSVGLTEAGERFLSRAKPAFEELVVASELARELGQRPAGLLRLTVPHAVVPILLEPLIASFCQAYPDVEVEIAAAAGPVKAGNLVRVLEPFAPMAPGVFIYYPSRHQMMPKLRAFIDHVKSRSNAADKIRTHIR
jgi:DNA-binding transcriptional LysR family regulator